MRKQITTLPPIPQFPWSGCKDKGAPVGAMGECLSCTAEAGVACRLPSSELKALAERTSLASIEVTS